MCVEVSVCVCFGAFLCVWVFVCFFVCLCLCDLVVCLRLCVPSLRLVCVFPFGCVLRHTAGEEHVDELGRRAEVLPRACRSGHLGRLSWLRAGPRRCGLWVRRGWRSRHPGPVHSQDECMVAVRAACVALPFTGACPVGRISGRIRLPRLLLAWQQTPGPPRSIGGEVLFAGHPSRRSTCCALVRVLSLRAQASHELDALLPALAVLPFRTHHATEVALLLPLFLVACWQPVVLLVLVGPIRRGDAIHIGVMKPPGRARLRSDTGGGRGAGRRSDPRKTAARAGGVRRLRRGGRGEPTATGRSIR